MQRIGVIGCGLMGSGIAEVCARSDAISVAVVEESRDRLDAGRSRIEARFEHLATTGKLSVQAAEEAFAKIGFGVDVVDVADCDLVVEAVIESEVEKLEVFRQLDKVIPAENAIFATNTSSIPIMKLAMATSRPQNVIGLHFFNPVPVLPLVELIPSLLTSPETIGKVEDFARDTLGKHIIRSQDRAGFIVNALLVPYLLSAIRMLESGFATSDDIDTGMMRGCAHPMGPLALTDLVGLDTTLAIAESMYDEFKEPLFAPPPLLSRMVDAGLLGRKSGRGFFEYAR